MIKSKKPQVIIATEIFDSIEYLTILNSELEFSMIGNARYCSRANEIEVLELIPAHCENTATETVLDEIKICEDISKLDVQEGEFLVWLHSHNSMSASFSGTDYETMETLTTHDDSMLLSIVVNNKMQFQAHWLINSKKLGYVQHVDLDVVRKLALTDGDMFELETLAASKFKEKKIVFNNPVNNQKNSFYRGHNAQIFAAYDAYDDYDDYDDYLTSWGKK